MAKLAKLTGKELLEKFGFVYSHTTGSHWYTSILNGRQTVIPHKKGFGNNERRIYEIC